MSKTIKFNLFCDNKSVRTIEDLQNNFSVEDVLNYFNNKILHRWLKVRKYDNELKAVSAINSTDSVEIIKELIRIFDITSDQDDIEAIIDNFNDIEERKKRCTSLENFNYNETNIIDDYKNKYKQLIDEIIQYKTDMSIIKKNISELVAKYKWVLNSSYKRLFYILLENKNYLAIMCLLMNENTRKYYLDDSNAECKIDINNINDVFQFVSCNYHNDEKQDFKSFLSDIVRDPNFQKSLGSNLKTFIGTDYRNWVEIEPKGKKCMIIYMGNPDCVRPVGETNRLIYNNALVNKFIILDGIDYKVGQNNVRKCPIIYMEV